MYREIHLDKQMNEQSDKNINTHETKSLRIPFFIILYFVTIRPEVGFGVFF